MDENVKLAQDALDILKKFGEKSTEYQDALKKLNDATLKNLAILDQQFTRQAQAKSATKAIAQTALSSIADKIAKNKLENRTLGIYENLYNYRFGPNGVAYNLNPMAQFMIPNVAYTDPESRKQIKAMIDKMEGKAKNGSIVKGIKNL